MRKSVYPAGLIVVSIMLPLFFACQPAREGRMISEKEYLDKMKAAWIGQMAGVGWGAPTEFKHIETVIPEDQVPEWKPEMINQFDQDDIYVEMTFLATLEKYGLDVTPQQAGLEFANTGYMLWAANRQGRDNLRQGIAPPASSHPRVNSSADDIDYQIEADFSGIIAPGMPQVPIDLGETFGRIMNYGDGLYGGQFVGGMYAAAYFESDIQKIIQAGLSCIHPESLYAQVIRDVLSWYQKYPDDWQQTWQLLEQKYMETKDNQPFAAQNEKVWLPIDAKINGAYIVMGLLYGEGDPDQTITISMRCGKDSDCNPSNAAGILFTTMGFEQLPDKYKSGLEPQNTFSHTQYSFNELLEVCQQLTRQLVQKYGGDVVEMDGETYYLIPDQEPEPGPLKKSWAPEPYQAIYYTPEKMDQIEAYPRQKYASIMNQFAPAWEVDFAGKCSEPTLLVQWQEKNKVLVTCPMNENRGVQIRLKERIAGEPGKKTYLKFAAGQEGQTSWKLKVNVNYKNILDQEISPATTEQHWQEFSIDITEFTDSNWFFLLLEAESVGGNMAPNYWADLYLVGEENI
ncbi:MAG: ADP-ribosylglycohydrolase family protein [Candidatus Cyclobacteriaceae bacterium M3_2C_046]